MTHYSVRKAIVKDYRWCIEINHAMSLTVRMAVNQIKYGIYRADDNTLNQLTDSMGAE